MMKDGIAIVVTPLIALMKDHSKSKAKVDQKNVNEIYKKTRKGEKPIFSRKVGHLSEMNNKVIYK